VKDFIVKTVLIILLFVAMFGLALVNRYLQDFEYERLWEAQKRVEGRR
jgi:hypothetical protein